MDFQPDSKKFPASPRLAIATRTHGQVRVALVMFVIAAEVEKVPNASSALQPEYFAKLANGLLELSACFGRRRFEFQPGLFHARRKRFHVAARGNAGK